MSFLTTLDTHVTLTEMAAAADFLLHVQNSDGGWGYRAGGMSYVESTSCVLVALSTLASVITSEQQQAREHAVTYLSSLQHSDGGWGVGAIDPESGWMTSWATYALARSRSHDDAADRGITWLIGSEGARATAEADRTQIRDLFKIDSTLIGFPWQPGDAAWVHPTALAILALCTAGKQDHLRTRQGVAYLKDRAVESGGWNIGNPEMIGKPMAATAQDTAVALLALHAAKEPKDLHIERGLTFLTRIVRSTSVASELAWAAFALKEWQHETSDALARLAAAQGQDGSWGSNPFVTAAALLAGAL